MEHVKHPLLRPFMLVSMVVLVLQLCFPVQLQASVLSAQQLDVISLGTKDPAEKPGVDLDLDMPAVTVQVLSVPAVLDAPLAVPPDMTDVEVPTLLVVAGFHPSAP